MREQISQPRPTPPARARTPSLAMIASSRAPAPARAPWRRLARHPAVGRGRRANVVAAAKAADAEAPKLSSKASSKKASSSSSSATGTAVGAPATIFGLPPLTPAQTAGMFVGAFVLAKALFRTRSALGGRRRGSVAALEERGALDENRDVDEEKFFRGMMKSVRTVEMPSLTEAQISAARERRRRARVEEDGGSLRDVSLPKNHPWATSDGDGDSAEERKKKADAVREANRPRTRQRGTPPPEA